MKKPKQKKSNKKHKNPKPTFLPIPLQPPNCASGARGLCRSRQAKPWNNHTAFCIQGKLRPVNKTLLKNWWEFELEEPKNKKELSLSRFVVSKSFWHDLWKFTISSWWKFLKPGPFQRCSKWVKGHALRPGFEVKFPENFFLLRGNHATWLCSPILELSAQSGPLKPSAVCCYSSLHCSDDWTEVTNTWIKGRKGPSTVLLSSRNAFIHQY